MAKPDCDDGYYKLSYELAAAMLTFGFGEIEGFIIGRVLEQQYGWAKKKMVHIRTCEVASLLDVDRRLVNRAIHKLIGVGVLLDLGDDCYTFVKDYESWETPHWKQAKRDRWVLFAKRAPKRAKADRPKAAPADRDGLIACSDGPSDYVISKDDKSDDADETLSSSKMTTCHLQSRQLVISKDDTQGVPPGPPIGEAHAELRMEEVEKAKQAASSPAASVMSDDEPFLPSADSPPPMTVDWAAVDARIAQVKVAIAKTVANHAVYAGHLEEWCERYPADWVIKAIEHGAWKGKNQARPQGFVGGLLTTWAAVKGPENDPIYMATRRVKAPAAITSTFVPNAKPDYLKYAEGAVPAPPRPKGQTA